MRVRPFVAALAFLSALLAPTHRCIAETSPSEEAAPTKPSTVIVAARGGRDLIEAAETSKVVAVGRFSAISKIDVHGYAGDFRVDQGLVGSAKPGAVLRVAWEELAVSRPVRFKDGERVMLCLESPPAYTLWQKRFPDNFADVLAVARDGEAFWLNPDAKTLAAIDHYLSLGKTGREDAIGLAYLVDMIRSSPDMVAMQAISRLEKHKNLASRLGGGSVNDLAKAATEELQSTTVRREVLALIGRAEMRGARNGIEPLARVDGPLRAQALLTLGKLDGKLPSGLVTSLLDHADGEVRAVGALYVQGGDATPTLVRMATKDAAAAVRVAAVHRLLGEHGREIFGEIAPALGDEDDSVRFVVARDVAKLGEPIVETLEELANNGTQRQGEGVVLTLSMIGGEAGKALVRIHHNHENASVRAIAGLALGRISGNDDH